MLARGERARYFGAGRSDEYLLSDAGLKALQTYEIGVRELANNAPEIRAWMEGFAAGYNEFLRRTPGERESASSKCVAVGVYGRGSRISI